MPQVPVYGDRQVRSEALQPVFQNAIDVSSGARALAQGMNQAAEAADRIDYRDAQDASFKAQYQLRNDWDAYSAKLRETYKKDQADLYQAEADKWWQEAKKKYTTELNPRAQALAGQAMGQYEQAQRAATTAYVEREKAQAREINFKALQSTQMREALQSATPETAGAIASVTAEALRKNAQEYATANGLGSVVAESMVREQLDTLHKSMALMLASRPDGMQAANAYLAEHGKDMPPGDRDAVMRQVEVTAKVAKRERWDTAAQQAFALANQGKPVPASLRSLMDQENDVPKLDALISARSNRLARAAEGGDGKVKTDWAVYEDVRTRIAGGEKVNVSAYSEKIAPSEIEKLIDLKTKAATKAPEVATAEQQMGPYIDKLGIGGTRNAEKRGQFKSAAQDLFNEHLKRTGKEPTFDERQQILEKLSVKVVTNPGLIWDTEAPAYTLPREQLRKLAAPEKFTVGQIYRDAKGNRAKYLGQDKWEPVK